MSIDLFNESLYLQMNPDVREAVENGWITAREHFERYGKDEGRIASILFNPVSYLALNPDVADAVAHGWLNAYQHFEWFGMHENRSPFEGFDAGFYLEQNPDVAAAVQQGWITAVEHFMNYGYTEIRNFNPAFNLVEFLNSHPEAAAAVQGGAMTAAEALIQWFSPVFNGEIELPPPPPQPPQPPEGEDGFGVDIDGVYYDFDAILEFVAGFGITREQLIDLEHLIIDSGLLTPENLDPNGGGLINPMPLVELVINYFYGEGGPGIILPPGFPDLPDLGFIGLPDLPDIHLLTSSPA